MRPFAARLSWKPWALIVWTAGMGAALLLSANTHAAEHNPALHPPKVAAAAVTERVIVKFRGSAGLSTQASTNGESASGTAQANIAADSARMNALATRRGFSVQATRALGGNMHMMRITPLSNNETSDETLARLRADSEVEFAELDRRVYPHAVSNDPLAVGQWYHQSVQPSATNANAAWDITTGSNGVVVAVVDTGVRFDHPDLGRASFGGRILPGYDFISGDSSSSFRTANDGNGRDSDASDPGDWVASSDDCGDLSNSSWHGTRVSGIIAARTNNGAGVAGLMWNGFILPVRVIGKCGGFNSDVLAGLRWAAGLSVPGVPTNPYPARVINVSLGGIGACDSASAATIRDVTAAGSLVVVSAGNESGPVDSPANCPGAMGVVAIRHRGTKVGFSSLGPQIAISAPGGNCVNIDGGPCLFSIDTTSNDGTTSPANSIYLDSSRPNVGTSFSAPIVSGIAGLMLAVNGNLTSPQLIQRMQNGSTKPFPTTSDTGTPPVCHVPTGPSDTQLECSCTTSTCGAGMANALGAVNDALRPIAAVSAPATVTPGGNVSIDGSGSAASCNHSIASHAWTVVSGSVALSNANTSTVSFQAPASGTATIRLTVTDETGKTDTADVTVTATTTSTTAPARAGSNACLASVVPPSGISLSATNGSASEAGVVAGSISVSRFGSTASALTVALSFSGTAASGRDYQAIPSSVTIPAGSASTTITVTPVDNTAVDGSRSLTVTAVTGAGYDLGDGAAATVTIADNDTAPAPGTSDANRGGGGGGGALEVLTLLTLLGVLSAPGVLSSSSAARRLRASCSERSRRGPQSPGG